jgi:putative oxidoreductase
MDLALFALRIVAGLLMAGHGAQKLFGSFGGHGIAGTGQFFESLGLRPGHRHARLAGLSELGGGLLLVLGLLTPLGAAAVIGVMTVAILTVHLSKGPWSSDGGYEYNLVLISIAFALGCAGPGGWSIDHALGLNTGGVGWGLAALGAGVLGGMGMLIAARGGGGAQRDRKPAAARTAPSPVPEPADGDARFTHDPATQPMREPARDPLDRR